MPVNRQPYMGDVIIFRFRHTRDNCRFYSNRIKASLEHNIDDCTRIGETLPFLQAKTVVQDPIHSFVIGT